MTLAPQWDRLDTVPLLDRSDAWEQVVEKAYTPVTLMRRLPTSFDAAVRRRAFGDISIAECVCDPHAGTRSRQLVQAETEPCIGLQIALAGSEAFHFDGDEAHLRAGSAILWSSRQAFDYTVVERLHKITVVIPWRELETRVVPNALERGRIVRSDDGVGALLFPMIGALTRQFGDADSRNDQAIRRAIIELAVGLLTDDENGQVRSRSEHRLVHVQAYIMDHLSDAELRLCDIARATGVSLRYLHLIFERSGTSVSNWILNARLERCREALIDPRQSARSITDIAFAVGFNNTAYFSRAFKRRFGFRPSDCRCPVRNELTRRGCDLQMRDEPIPLRA